MSRLNDAEASRMISACSNGSEAAESRTGFYSLDAFPLPVVRIASINAGAPAAIDLISDRKVRRRKGGTGRQSVSERFRRRGPTVVERPLCISLTY